MSYELRAGETIEAGVRRIAGEQIADARATADDASETLGERIHEVRKTCKKVRGLVRLVRPALGKTYAVENRWFRDTARLLAEFRDAETAIATLDELAEPMGPDGGGKEDAGAVEVVAPIRRLLVSRRDSVWSTGGEPAARLAEATKRIAEAAERVENWLLSTAGPSAFRGGLKKTYRRARNGYKVAAKRGGTDSDQNHEWRKRVKYHWYHLRLLSDGWAEIMGCWSDEAHRLSSLLGTEHDLAVLREIVMGDLLTTQAAGESAAEPEAATAAPTEDATEAAKKVLALIADRREGLIAEALSLGARLFAEKPDALISRIESYWVARRQE